MNEVTRWFWIRHGPTHQKTFTGWRDVPADLSDKAALERLRHFLPEGAVLVSSDLKRAVDTLAALQLNGEQLATRKDLREIDFGQWDGMAWDDIAAQWPEQSRSFWEQPGDIKAPGGESWNDLTGRLYPAVDELIDRFKGRDIVCVAHLGVIVAQIQRALGVSAYKAFSHKIDPLSVTELTITGDDWHVERINHIC